MIENIKTKWIEALRSGKYEQGKGKLRSEDNKFCCLGVLADVLTDGKFWESEEYSERQLEVLTEKLMQDAGLQTQIGYFTIYSLSQEMQQKLRKEFKIFYNRITSKKTLAALNDQGVSFDIIADIIESRPEGLFKE